MLVLVRCFSYTSHASFIEEFLLHSSCCFFLRSFSYTPHVFNEEYLTLLMVVPVRCFSYTPHADHSEEFQSHTATSPAGSARISSIIFSSWRIQTRHTFFLYYNCNEDTDAIPGFMLRPNKDARGYSSVRLTSRASHRLGKCRLSWVWLGLGLLSALSECSACLGRGSHRHASSGFVFGTDWSDRSVLTWPRPYIYLSFDTHRAV